MSKNTAATLPVFRPGTHTAMDGRTVTFTLENCLDLAESYDPTLMESPFVIGHPKDTAPAYGWAGGYEVRDGLVYAEPKQVAPEFAEAFNQGRWKKRSLSIYLPDSPGNPKPGHYYPRHVGFLGAIAPAIKGLPDVCFAEMATDNAPVEFALPWEDDVLVDIFRALRDHLIEREGVEKADHILPSWRINTLVDALASKARDDQPNTLNYAEGERIPMEIPSNAPDITARTAELDAREQTLKLREQEMQQTQKAQRRHEITDFAERLVTAGKLLPVQKNRLVEIMVNLPEAPMSFAEGDATVTDTPEALLRDLLQTRPAVLDFSEKSAQTGSAPLDFADPHALAEAAQSYVAEQARNGRTVSVSEAVTHIKGATS
ncbi:peptidase [Providencia rettgeri]